MDADICQPIAEGILDRYARLNKDQCFLVSVVGGGQIIGKNGSMRTHFANSVTQEVKNTNASLKVEILSTDSYLKSFDDTLRAATLDEYDFSLMTLDIRTLLAGGQVTVTDFLNDNKTQRTLGPNLNILMFEGICSAWTREILELTNICIGVIETTEQEYLDRESARLGKLGYSIQEVLNVFMASQFSVRKDILAPQLQEKVDITYRFDEEPPQMYIRK